MHQPAELGLWRGHLPYDLWNSCGHRAVPDLKGFGHGFTSLLCYKAGTKFRSQEKEMLRIYVEYQLHALQSD